MSFLWSLASFIIVIGVLVTVHEFGHFWAARKCGIKVHRFSVGFGKVIWSKFDKHGTEFALSLIPLGGYVKMLDERNEAVPQHLQSQSFNSKTVWQRAFVIAAGPIANFIFAILAYWLIFLAGVSTVKPVIADIQANSIAAEANLQPNSQILAIDGTQVDDWQDINILLASKLGNQQIVLSVSPVDEHITTEKVLNTANWSFNPEQQSAFSALGIEPISNQIEMKISRVVANSPAAKANLKIGDLIYNKHSQNFAWRDFIAEIQKGQPFEIVVQRNGKYFKTKLVPEFKDNSYFVGISPTVIPIPEQYRMELKYGMLDAILKSLEKTAQLSWLTIKIIGKLFTGDLSLNNLSGPISIAQGAGISSQIGLIAYLSFMALISVNLAIMNLFPLPILDGGHLVFLAAEAIRGKPLPESVQNMAFRIGSILLLILTAFALFNDFLRL